MIVENPVSGVRKRVLGPLHRLWCFFFGCFYYAFKGMWGTALFSFITFNGLFVLFPLWNRSIVKNYYEALGWREIASADVIAPADSNSEPPKR